MSLPFHKPSAIIGLTIGAVIGAGLLASFPPHSADRALISDWREVHLGDHVNQVIGALGQPSNDIPIGTPFPGFSDGIVPDDYYLDHGLLVFVIPDFPTHVLLIYYNEDRRVTYVASVST